MRKRLPCLMELSLGKLRLVGCFCFLLIINALQSHVPFGGLENIFCNITHITHMLKHNGDQLMDDKTIFVRS